MPRDEIGDDSATVAIDGDSSGAFTAFDDGFIVEQKGLQALHSGIQ